MKKINGLPDYLSALSDSDRSRFAALSSLVSTVAVPPQIQKFVFLPNQTDHPDWDDAAMVFWNATQELYLEHARSEGELPLLYWGFHSYDLLARRSSNGVLLTDASMYVMDVGSTFVGVPRATVDASSFTRRGNVVDFGVGGIDLTPARRLMDEPAIDDSLAFLSTVVSLLAESAPAAAASVEDTVSVDQLIERSTFSSEFDLASRPADAKRITKLASKWKLPADETVILAFSSATFMGVYGLAVTEKAVYTRDLMEPLERTARADVDPGQISWDAEKKGARITGSQVMPTLPSINDDNRDYFLDLLRKVLAQAPR